MATDSFWEAKRHSLFEESIGPLARLPMSHEAMIAYGPASAVFDACHFLALGCEHEAHKILDSFLPAVTKQGFFESIQHIEQRASVAGATNCGYWLRYGAFDSKLASTALQYHLELNEWWGGRMTPPNVHETMLLALEADQPDTAAEYYEKHEKVHLSIPPENLRFSRNARSLLYLHIKEPKHTMAQKGLASFVKAATKWDKGIQPIPYISIDDAARTYYACRTLTGESVSLQQVLATIR